MDAAKIMYSILTFLFIMLLPMILTNLMLSTNTPNAYQSFNNFFQTIGGWFVWIIISALVSIGVYIKLEKM